MTTLFINTCYSTCGACGRNADPHETAHLNVTMQGEGCGAVYTELSSHYAGSRIREAATALRPDLPWTGVLV